MKMKFGAIVVDGRGKIGGHVASKNRSGAYLRTKVTPVNRNTSFQQGVRNLFTSLSQGWKSLTQEQRDAWNAAVASYQSTNVFGDLKTPTGAALYQRLNNNLSQIGEDFINTPPTPGSVSGIYAVSLIAHNYPETLSLVLSDALMSGEACTIDATEPVSPGVSFVNNKFRNITFKTGATSSPIDLLATYKAKFGAISQTGSKIFVRLTMYNAATGQAGTPSIVSSIIND